jgi:hypothetical protein
VHFNDKSKLLDYLNNPSFEGSAREDTLLFLRTVALYKIWLSIGYLTNEVEQDIQLQKFIEQNNTAIALIAKQVANIE